ncbi:hypothetical protein GH733_013640, partial [Mirounga leonina]
MQQRNWRRNICKKRQKKISRMVKENKAEKCDKKKRKKQNNGNVDYRWKTQNSTVEIMIENQPLIFQFHGNPSICPLPKKLRTYEERRLKG